MFMGHYAAAFAARAVEPRLSLSAAFVACQAVDIAWGALVLGGIERAHLDPTLPSNPLVLEHIPYTHSLLGTLAFAAVGYGVGRALRWPNAAALAFAGAVLSHWVLDLLVHRPDLTLYGVPPKLGLRLWDWPAAALSLELALIVGAGWACFRRAGGSARAVGGLVGLLVVLQIVTFLSPVPPSITPVAAAALPTFLGLPLLAWWLDRRPS